MELTQQEKTSYFGNEQKLYIIDLGYFKVVLCAF